MKSAAHVNGGPAGARMAGRAAAQGRVTGSGAGPAGDGG